MQRGVRVVTIRGVRDAVDVKAALDERGPARTAKSCGPDAPVLASCATRSRVVARDDASHHAVGAIKPVPKESAYKP
ncbi:hypothetical protein BRAS3843_1070043 [Bradyrhizobium sp. STM 3843]|nr:hypothetical protein BRAS3843_1070043 [Bradyrhizobium sp. STM 3843]